MITKPLCTKQALYKHEWKNMGDLQRVLTSKPTELLWDEMSDLTNSLTSEWTQIPTAMLENLSEILPRRVEEKKLCNEMFNNHDSCDILEKCICIIYLDIDVVVIHH